MFLFFQINEILIRIVQCSFCVCVYELGCNFFMLVACLCLQVRFNFFLTIYVTKNLALREVANTLHAVIKGER